MPHITGVAFITPVLLTAVTVALAGVLWAVVVLSGRLGDAMTLLEEINEDQRRQPTRDELHHWLVDVQTAITNGLREARSASVQLRQTTETLGRRVQQVENLTGVVDQQARRRWVPDQLDPRNGQ